LSSVCGLLVTHRFNKKIVSIIEEECDPVRFITVLMPLLQKTRPKTHIRASLQLDLSMGLIADGRFDEALALLRTIVIGRGRAGFMECAAYFYNLCAAFLEAGNLDDARHALDDLTRLCGECGANYRRITRSSGEVVWRCANRVKHGHEICKHSLSVPESDIIAFTCETRGIKQFNLQIVRDSLDTISINSDGTMIPNFKPANTMTFSLWNSYNFRSYILAKQFLNMIKMGLSFSITRRLFIYDV
jgi:hypothetical protein